ncbi:gas1-like protein [Colletotrichum sojae]|uniref:Gas1-like protein n=1 Tax=Colletotrichum sojae TaxID=2175907 RepID=A0A8H6MPS2_9PEZI|nr:gas1-like protein [Colletotrichum sojae]
MASSMRALAISALLAVAHGQGVILKAQGAKGPASLPLQVDTKKADANVINNKEIVDNAVNECGRTILGGNIDIGENTENQLIAKTVTQVTKGSTVDIQIAQVSADGAGPYTCDMDLTSNANGATGQTPLKVQESQPQNGIINLKVTMPNDMACVGASTGDVCTIRCFNSNAKGPFGGCVAVQQTDTTPKQNTPDNIPTAQTLSGILTQVQQNAKDLPAAFKSNAEAKTQEEQGLTAIKEILGNNATNEAAGPAGGAAGGNNNNNNGGGNGNNNANNGNNGGGNGRNRGKGKGNNNNANTGAGAGNGRNRGNGRGGNAGNNNNAANGNAGNGNGRGAGANTQAGGGGRGRNNNNNNNNNQANNKRDLDEMPRLRRARRNLAPRQL